MLNALVIAVAFAAQRESFQPSSIPVAEAISLFSKAGYPVKMAARVEPSGTIRINGATVQVLFSSEPGLDTTTDASSLARVHLRIEIPVVRHVPLNETNVDRGMYTGENELKFIPHLGGTADLATSLPLDKRTTASAIKKAIAKFRDEGMAYAEANDGEFRNAPRTDWSKVRFVDSLVFDRADEVSLARLFTAWGFAPYGSVEPASYLTGASLNVGGTAITVRVGSTFEPEPAHTLQLLATVSPPKGEDSFTWAVAQGHAMSWLRALPSLKGPSEFRQDIEVSKSLTVGSLRNKILNFAATMRSIGSEPEGG